MVETAKRETELKNIRNEMNQKLTNETGKSITLEKPPTPELTDTVIL